MKRLRIIISVLLTCVVLTATMPLCVSATTDTTVMVETKSVRPGDAVTLAVDISAVTNIDGLSVDLLFDETKLEFVSGEACGFLQDAMAMKDVLLVAGSTNRIRISAIGAPVSGEGTIAKLTFRVKVSAPEGMAGVTFDITDNSGILFGGKLTAFSDIAGGVEINREAPPAETVPSAAPTSPTVFGYQIPVVVQGGAADPGDEVEVYVSVLGASELTMASVHIYFDSSAVSFVKGEVLGDDATPLRIDETNLKKDCVTISRVLGDTFSLNGRVAKLVFRVKSTAKKGDYLLRVSGDLYKNDTVLPVETRAGNIHVNKDGIGAAFMTVLVILGVVAGAAIIAAIVVLVVILKKKSSSALPSERKQRLRDSDVSDDEL